MTSSSDTAPRGGKGGGAAAKAAAPAPTSRQSQKEATGRRVMEAARELFDTQGYEGTTVREIASHAGVSVGSVFTTFASKGDILSAVMQARLDGLYAELDRVTPHLRGSTADRLRTTFSIHFAFEAQHTHLFLAHIAATYDWTLPPSAQPMGRNGRLMGIIADCLARGVAEGDVDPQLAPQEIIDLLMAAYVWIYRLAAWRDAGPEEMTTIMDRQIGLICEGFRPRT